MIPTGHYELPPLSDFVVTETICPDPNAPEEKEKITLSQWYLDSSRGYTIGGVVDGLTEIIFGDPYPDDVDIEFEDRDKGNVFVFSDGKRVEVR